jgi:hypothetical protein
MPRPAGDGCLLHPCPDLRADRAGVLSTAVRLAPGLDELFSQQLPRGTVARRLLWFFRGVHSVQPGKLRIAEHLAPRADHLSAE